MRSRDLVLRVFVAGVAAVIAISAGYALSYPERWNEELVGLYRKDAWSQFPEVAKRPTEISISKLER